MSWWNTETVEFTPTLTVANDGVSYIFDQTQSGATAIGATVGTTRDWRGGRLRGLVSCTAQNVTLRSYLLDLTTWVADSNGPGGGSLVIVAGTQIPFDWKINGIGRMDILNGATGPTLLQVTGLQWTPSMEKGDF